MAISQERTVKQTKDLIDRILEDLKQFDPGVEDPEKDRLEAELASVVDGLEPNFIGPTWQKNPDGTPYLPARNRSLGWGILAWCKKYLLHFKGEDRPIELTKEQQRTILWWYAIDENGRWVYESGVLQRAKGTGKDPLAAVISVVEFVGPCRFDGWDSFGMPKARSNLESHIQVAAVNATQTKNTSQFFLKIISKQLKAEYGIMPFTSSTKTIKARDGLQRLQMVTSSPRAIEGARASFTLLNEALALDTPIPTPSGPRSMGDLADGDVIFGSDGSPVAVTKAHETQVGRDCYRVTMSNGASVVASDGHLWMTKVASSAAKPRVRTTSEMVADGRRFMIPRAGIQWSQDVTLPLDPYVLGAWLGDGSTGGCNVTIGDSDAEEMMAEFASRGVPLRELGRNKSGANRYSFSERVGYGEDMGTPTARALRALPCYRDKHIPESYLCAGTDQRIELLRGLMDTDGCLAKGDLAIFVGTERLARDVFRLASTLGLRPGMNFQADDRSRHGGVWRVHFITEGFNPFSMPRKASRVNVRPGRKWISISIDPVDSVPVRCISVDADDHLFQAGDGVVTHNTHHFIEGNQGIAMYETVDGNATKGQGSRYLAITNAYLPGEDSVAERMRGDYEMIKDRPDRASFRFFYDSIEAHELVPMHPVALRVTIPKIRGDAIWLDPEKILASIRKKSIANSRSRRMWLNQIVSSEDAIWSEADWRMLESELYLRPGDMITLGFDGGRTDDSTALVAIRVSDLLSVPLGIWEKDGEDWVVPREAVHSAVALAFKTYNVVAFFADVNLWEHDILEWHGLYGEKLKAKAVDAGNAIGWDMRGTHNPRVTLAHERLMSAIIERKVKWSLSVNPELVGTMRRHFLNVYREENNTGVHFRKVRKDSPRKIDCYAAWVAAYEALYKYRIKGKEERPANQLWMLGR